MKTSLFNRFLLLAFAALPLTAHATVRTWDASSGFNWDTTNTSWTGTTWDNTTSDQAVFAAAGVGTVTLTTAITANKLTFDNAGYTITGDILTLSGTTPILTANADAAISSIIAGSAAITKNGAGKLTLSGANTLTANVTVSQGTLKLGAGGVLNRGLKTSGAVANNAIFNLAGGSMTVNNAGNFDIGGASETGTVNVTSGTLDIKGGSELTINNTNGATANWNQTGGTVSVTTGNHIYTGMGTGSGVTTNISFSGNSAFTVNATNASVTFTIGGRSLTNVTVSDNAAIDAQTTRFGWGSNLTATDGGTLNLNGGTWKTNRITVENGSILKGDVNLNGGVLQARQNETNFISSSSNNVTANVMEGGAKIDTNTFDITISEPLIHGGVAVTDGGLAKIGTGTLTLTGACTYTGPTTVNEGILKLGAGGSASASPTVTVAAAGTLEGWTVASGQTLRGAGMLAGSTIVAAGGTLSPGVNDIGTMTSTGSLTLGGNAVFQINKNGATLSNDSVTGLSSVTYGGTLTVTATGDPLANGDTFTLFESSSYQAVAFTTLTLPSLPAGLYWDSTNLQVDGSIKVTTISYVGTPSFSPPPGGFIGAQSVTLTSDSGSTIHYTIDGGVETAAASPVTVAVPVDATTTILAYASKAGHANSPSVEGIYNAVTTPTWTYDGSGVWTNTLNWNREVIGTGSGVTADFSSLELTGDRTVSLNGPRTIGSLIFGDVANTYSWTLAPGTGGPLTLDNGANSPVVTVNNQTTVISAALAGSNGLSKAGGGTLRLSGNNTYTGGTTINSGTLEFVTPGITTYSGGQINLNNGATMKIYEAGFPYRYDFGAQTYNFGATGGGTISTTGANTNWVAQGDWTFKTNGGAKNTITSVGGMNLNGKSIVFDVTAGTNGTSDLDVGSSIGNTIGSLTKTGAGVATLSATNGYTGATAVNAGTLAVTGTLGATAVTVASGATLDAGANLSGKDALGASVSVNSGGHFLVHIAATPAAQVTRTITGNLTLSSGNLVDLIATAAPADGTYTLVTAASIIGSPGAGSSLTLGSGRTATLSVSGGTSLVLTVTGSGYQSWMAAWVANGFTGDPALGADPDGDGMTNLLEYVLNGNPGASDRSILPQPQVTATNFVFTFTRRLDSASDSAMVLEYGSNLTGWTSVNITGTPGAEVSIGAATGTAPNQVQTVTVTIPRSAAVNGKLFGRLKVTQP